MNIIELLSKNNDIYDALADYHELDLVELQTPSEFIRALDLLIHNKNEIIMAAYVADDDETPRCNKLAREIADLCMIRGFVTIIVSTNFLP